VRLRQKRSAGCDSLSPCVQEAEQLGYDGERLVPDEARLRNLLIEDLSKFHFASQYAMDKSVLDAGCGAGQGSAYLAQKEARHVIGVDISAEAVAYANGRYVSPGRLQNLAFGRMDVTHLAFSDQTFDMVTSIEVIEHLDEPEHYVAEIRRLLRDHGVLVLSTPNKHVSSPTPGSMWPHHVHEFYPDELQALLERYFSDVELWGLSIPVYDQHPVRRIVHRLAPLFKPILPLGIRTRFLPTLQSMIKSDLDLDDIVISRERVTEKPTLLAICRT
jgi:2-polyprenyl-3-methyl-5-hydroxy-6-metoxy-1,4-benzoquinol methylase